MAQPQGKLIAWQQLNNPAGRSQIRLLNLEADSNSASTATYYQLDNTARNAQAIYLASTNDTPVVTWCDDSAGTMNVYAALLDLKRGIQSTYHLTNHSTYACVPNIVSRQNCIGIVWNDSRRTNKANDFSQSDIYFNEICKDAPFVTHRI